MGEVRNEITVTDRKSDRLEGVYEQTTSSWMGYCLGARHVVGLLVHLVALGRTVPYLSIARDALFLLAPTELLSSLFSPPRGSFQKFKYLQMHRPYAHLPEDGNRYASETSAVLHAST
jgi:hypothetical protein